MNDNAKVEQHRLERGMILTLLAQAPTPKVAFRTLMMALDRRGVSIYGDKLTYHLERYLEMRGYVRLTRARDMKGVDFGPSVSPDAIQFIQLTPEGLHILNEPEKDPEIRIL